ncbi:MAG: pyruvate kinase [Anaerolineae bacterium]
MISSHLSGKRTKIVATLGPRSRDEGTIRQMIRAGMDVARINFSHGDHETHGATIDLVRRIAAEEGAVVAVLGDIQGPKIRIGLLEKEPIELKPGDKVTLTLDPANGENNIINLPHPEFLRDLRIGNVLLLDDGKLEFIVRSAAPTSVVAEVVVGGPLSSRKGIMAPNARLTLSAITPKDKADIEFALSKQVDYIAMSFVRSVDDLREIHWLIRHLGGDTAVIAKIEKHEALENIEGIIDQADGIMVARGDLGIEIPAEEVPFHQKRIIRLANEAAKPVITATQMLNSMEFLPRPTRAEASDVYNAILDGTDAVMLSNETAAGLYPVRAVEMMVNIANIAERNLLRKGPDRVIRPQAEGREAISDAISQATVQVAESINARAIVTTTQTGYTTRRVARERPRTPIICTTTNPETFKRMTLLWGVTPVMIPSFDTSDEMRRVVVRTLYDQNFVERNDQIVLIVGIPFGVANQSNLLKVEVVGEDGQLDES